MNWRTAVAATIGMAALTGCSGATNDTASSTSPSAEQGAESPAVDRSCLAAFGDAAADYQPVDSPEKARQHADGAAVVRITGANPGHASTGQNLEFQYASLTAEVVSPLMGSTDVGDEIHVELAHAADCDAEQLAGVLPQDEDVVVIWREGNEPWGAGLEEQDGAVVDDPPKFLMADGLWYQDASGELRNPASTYGAVRWEGAKTVREIAQSFRGME